MKLEHLAQIIIVLIFNLSSILQTFYYIFSIYNTI
jgi:hypothetical protein